MRVTIFAAVFGLAFISTACDEPYADDPAIDPDAPVIRVASPARGAYLGDVGQVTVSGTVHDDSAIRELIVGGVRGAVAADGTFAVTVPLAGSGPELITVEAVDLEGNVGRETRSVSAGPLAPLAGRVDDAVTAAISDTAFAALGNALARTLADKDLGAWIAPRNPVLSKGAADGPDCLYGQVSVGALDIAGATIELLPTLGGLELSAELTGVRVPMRLRYAALCVAGASDALMTATKVSVSGRFRFGIKDGAFDVRLVSPVVRFEGFALELGGLPGDVVRLLDLGNTLGPMLAWAIEQLATPLLGSAFSSVDGTGSAELLGKTLDLSVSPAEIALSPVDARARLSSSLHFRGEPADATYVARRQARPALDPGAGLVLAVSDDAVNQLLASFWAAGGMTQRLELTTGDYGGLGKLYDRVEVHGAAPLAVRAEDDGLALVIPDVTLTFSNGDAVATKIAVNASLSVGVERGGDGALRLVSAAPRVFVDILDDGVAGPNPLARPQFETLTAFALARLTYVAAGLLGSVPLPKTDGASFTTVRARGAGGYLLIEAGAAE